MYTEERSPEQLQNTILEIESQLAVLKKKEETYRRRLALKTNLRDEAERKARTHRLIQLGALAEKYLSMHGMTVTDAEKLLASVVRLADVKKLLPENVPSETPPSSK